MQFTTSRLPRSSTRRLRRDRKTNSPKSKRQALDLVSGAFFSVFGRRRGNFLYFVSCYACRAQMVRRRKKSTAEDVRGAG